jgi:hypothetical protein
LQVARCEPLGVRSMSMRQIIARPRIALWDAHAWPRLPRRQVKVFDAPGRPVMTPATRREPRYHCRPSRIYNSVRCHPPHKIETSFGVEFRSFGSGGPLHCNTRHRGSSVLLSPRRLTLVKGQGPTDCGLRQVQLARDLSQWRSRRACETVC